MLRQPNFIVYRHLFYFMLIKSKHLSRKVEIGSNSNIWLLQGALRLHLLVIYSSS